MKRTFTKSWMVIPALLALVFSAIGTNPAHAAGITVNSLLDTTNASDGKCTLREAIINANNNSDTTGGDCAAGSGADTITFSVSGTIALSSTLSDIADVLGLTIDGSGQTVVISGNHAVRITIVDPSVPLTLNNLTIANGKSVGAGGGIFNDGSTSITNSTFSGNSAYEGGGVYNGGTLRITNSTFSGNTETTGGGGGIYTGGVTLSIANSIFSGNTASNNGGGGIYVNSGTNNIHASTFSGNSATNDGGGGIYNNGATLSVTDSGFSSNSAATDGGGIYNFTGGTASIANGTFSSNSAPGGGGGGIYNSGGLTITSSSFSANSAAYGSGIYSISAVTVSTSTFSGNGAIASSGGGIAIEGGTLIATADTFSDNSAVSSYGGGVFSNGGGLTIANSTFSGNSANYGGGLYMSGGTANIVNNTFSVNSASSSGGGIYNNLGTATLSNTIVAHSTTGGNCGGTIANGGSNIDDGTSCGWGSLAGSMSSTDPALGALSGSPAYFPLTGGSPAIDAGNDTVCAAPPVNNTSQNGLTRPQGPHCDIGSYEAIAYYSFNVASNGAQDGWVLESSELSNKGGTLNTMAKTINLGDDAARRQYRGILSFGTGAGLPDNAVITAVTLKVKKSAVVGGGNPVTMFKGFEVDIKNGLFGTAALRASDFQTGASQSLGPFKPLPATGWYSFDLSGASGSINKLGTGLTQIRLRFVLDDNNNAAANYLSLFSGNATPANRPQLIITYYVP